MRLNFLMARSAAHVVHLLGPGQDPHRQIGASALPRTSITPTSTSRSSYQAGADVPMASLPIGRSGRAGSARWANGALGFPVLQPQYGLQPSSAASGLPQHRRRASLATSFTGAWAQNPV